MDTPKPTADLTAHLTDLTPFLVRNLRTDIAKLDDRLTTTAATIDRRFDKLDHALDRRLTTDEFQDAMLALNQNIARTHARVVDIDIRSLTMHRETRGLIERVQHFIDARGGLEDRVTTCEAELADLTQRLP